MELSVVQSLLSALKHSLLIEVCSILGHKPELDYLCDAVASVKAVLLDSHAKQELPHEAQLWIQELKDMVYDADDLLDEFLSLAEQKQLTEDGKVSEEVCLFFSRVNLFDVAKNMIEGVKKVRKVLDTTACSEKQLGFNLNYSPIRKRREESGFSVCDDRIIGREDDTSKIVDILVDSDAHQGVSILTIVGGGGLGKTALARLVYTHKRVACAFPLVLWACISDQDQQQFDVKQILSKIMRSQTKLDIGYSTDYMIDQLIEHIAGRKFLLILDDVLTENHDQWVKLVDFFMAGKKGSWIVVTTRSKETAKCIKNGPIYELQGLSEENSWCLFERMAFEQETPAEDLAKIGQEIVEVCAGVPLAIKVVGSLLYGQGKDVWLSLQKTILDKMRDSKNNIMPLLKLSFQHLESSLQSCFIYCALFPKDFEIEKEILISLWMAQGYIFPLHGNQSNEEAGEEYYSILLHRSFSEAAQKDEHGYGDFVSCKINSLMYDIAQDIAGKEICTINSTNCKLDKVRHASVVRNQCTGVAIGTVNTISFNLDRKVHLSAVRSHNTAKSFIKAHLRTYFLLHRLELLSIDQSLENLTSLRSLVLKGSAFQRLPDTIGNLIHLRLLDLSENSRLNLLPQSIINLHNLQTLNLRHCFMLKGLPNGLSKLVKLKFLDIAYCEGITSLPSDLRKLTGLHILTKFKVEASSDLKHCFDQLEALKTLENLKGQLDIWIQVHKSSNNVEKVVTGGSYLRNKDRLSDLCFFIQHVESEARVDYEEALLEELQPHSNLRGLMFFGYGCMRMPSWARDESLSTFLPNLVRLQLSSCSRLQYLPNLGILPHLKILRISCIPNLEYMDASEPVSTIEESSVFPCLEELYLDNLINLKQWRKGELIREDMFVGGSNKQSSLSPSFPCFPRLKLLSVYDCQNLITVLLCPTVEDLQYHNFNRYLRVTMTSDSSLPKLLSVNTDNIEWFNLQPRAVFQCLSCMCISDKELESLSQAEEVFRSCSSSLQTLTLFNCFKLRNLSEGLEHLTALDTLILDYIPNLVINPEEEKNGMPWRCLHRSLRSLELKELTMLEKLPSGMQYLTNLHILSILDCQQLQCLPKWMQKLTSLRKLNVSSCYLLSERCRDFDGEDWPNIQHIPHVSIC